MKKMIALLVSLLLILSCAACGNTTAPTPDTQTQPTNSASEGQDQAQAGAPVTDPVQSGPAESEPIETALSLGTVNTVNGYSEFSLRKIVTTDIISCSFAGAYRYKLYQKPDLTYVDAVFDWTNLGTDSQYPYEVMEAVATTPDGTEYIGTVFAEGPDEEGHPHVQTDSIADMAPGTPQVLHAAFQVPADTATLSMKFTVLNLTADCDYTLGEVVTNAKELKVGDVLESEAAKLEFNGIHYSDGISPADRKGSYYSIQILDSSENTFLFANFNLTSKLDSDLDSMYFMHMTAKYDGDNKTYYDSEGAECASYEAISADGIPGFESIIAAGQTYNLNYRVAVPKSNLDKPLMLFLEFDGREYLYREN